MYITVLYYLLLFLLLLFVLLSFVLFFIWLVKFLLTQRRRLLEHKTVLFIEKVVNQISTQTYDSEWHHSGDKIIHRFKKKYVDRFNFDRRIVSHQLLILHRGLKGIASERVRDIYHRLEFDKTGIRILESNKKYFHAKVIRDLSQMRVSGAIPAITRLLRTGDEDVRLEASVALLTFNLDDPTVAMTHLTDMTLWQKIYFIESLKNLRADMMPDFARGLKSKNENIVEICLILCEHFKLNYDDKDARKLFFSSNLSIVDATATLLLNTNNTKLVKELIIELHRIPDIDTQVNIIKQVKLSDNFYLIPNLLEIIDSSKSSDEVKLETLRTVCRLCEKHGQEFSIDQLKTRNDKIEAMYRHAMEKLI